MKNFRFVLISLVCVSALTSVAFASGNSEDTGFVEMESSSDYGGKTITLLDSFGRTIELDKVPERVVSVAPNITESIFVLGRESHLVGRTDYCTFPAEVENIPSIGSLRKPSIEAIIALEPEIVIGSTHFQKETLELLEAVGIQVAVLYGPESFEGVYQVLTDLGTLLDAEEAATRQISDMQDSVRAVETAVKGLDPKSVYYVIAYGEYGDYTAGGGTFIDKMLTMAGGKNVAGDVEGWQYSLEKLVEKDPELLICSKNGGVKDALRQAAGYRELTAVKNDRLFEIDNNLVDRQGPRLAMGLRALAEIIHPEAFEK